MNRSKLALKSMSVALVAVFAINLVPQKANAVIFFTVGPVLAIGSFGVMMNKGDIDVNPAHIDTFGYVMIGGAVLAEAVLLYGVCTFSGPFCVLDKNVDGTITVTEQDLIDNMYSPETAQSIIRQTDELNQMLLAKKAYFGVDKGDSVDSLSLQIRMIMPNATSEFANFYARQSLMVSGHQKK